MPPPDIGTIVSQVASSVRTCCGIHVTTIQEKGLLIALESLAPLDLPELQPQRHDEDQNGDQRDG